MGIHIERFTFNGFQENTLVIDDGTHCVIIDPGCSTITEQQVITQHIEGNDLQPLMVLLTHSHIDHVLGCSYITQHFNIGFIQHALDVATLNAVASYAHVYGFPEYTPPGEAAQILQGDEVLTFGQMTFKVLFTPGHAPGHVVYYLESESTVINGDVLFSGSFGRVDLPGGDLETLKSSIFNVLFELPEDTLVYCGHGPETTIGQEKRTNYIHQH